jgi:hypothetical protein
LPAQRSRARLGRIHFEDHASNRNLVTGLEARFSQGVDHAHPPQPLLDLSQRLVILDVVAGE